MTPYRRYVTGFLHKKRILRFAYETQQPALQRSMCDPESVHSQCLPCTSMPFRIPKLLICPHYGCFCLPGLVFFCGQLLSEPVRQDCSAECKQTPGTISLFYFTELIPASRSQVSNPGGTITTRHQRSLDIFTQDSQEEECFQIHQ